MSFPFANIVVIVIALIFHFILARFLPKKNQNNFLGILFQAFRVFFIFMAFIALFYLISPDGDILYNFLRNLIVSPDVLQAEEIARPLEAITDSFGFSINVILSIIVDYFLKRLYCIC